MVSGGRASSENGAVEWVKLKLFLKCPARRREALIYLIFFSTMPLFRLFSQFPLSPLSFAPSKRETAMRSLRSQGSFAQSSGSGRVAGARSSVLPPPLPVLPAASLRSSHRRRRCLAANVSPSSSGIDNASSAVSSSSSSLSSSPGDLDKLAPVPLPPAGDIKVRKREKKERMHCILLSSRRRFFLSSTSDSPFF